MMLNESCAGPPQPPLPRKLKNKIYDENNILSYYFREPVRTTATLVRMYRNVSTYVPQLKQQQTNKQNRAKLPGRRL